MKLRFMILLAASMLILTSCALVSTELPENQLSDVQQNQNRAESKTDEDLVLEVDSSVAREVNLFLTNFSEVFYDPTLGFFGEAEEKIQFAYMHASINSPSLTFCKDGYTCISAKNVDSILESFFGSSVPHETPKDSKYWTFKDGNFVLAATAGKPCPNFSILTGMTRRQDGNFDVTFNIYSDPSLSEGNIISDKIVYSLTDSEAASKYKYAGDGRAVLKEKVFNEKNTYELVSYDVYYNLE